MSGMRPERAEAGRLREFATRCLTRLGALSPDEAEAVRVALGEMQILRAGSELIGEGVLLDKPQLLLDGWAVRHRVLSDGRRQIVSFIMPGDIYGLCARREGVSLCSTMALTAVTVAPLTMAAAALHGEHPTALGRMARDQLAQEEAFMLNHVVRLGRQSAQERLLSLLLEFHARLQQVHLAHDGSFTLPLTQEVLSDALGLSVVHTNRTLQQLKREHLIASKGSAFSLSDLKHLAGICDFRPAPRETPHNANSAASVPFA